MLRATSPLSRDLLLVGLAEEHLEDGRRQVGPREGLQRLRLVLLEQRRGRRLLRFCALKLSRVRCWSAGI